MAHLFELHGTAVAFGALLPFRAFTQSVLDLLEPGAAWFAGDAVLVSIEIPHWVVREEPRSSVWNATAFNPLPRLVSRNYGDHFIV